jgi:hypothetical protein
MSSTYIVLLNHGQEDLRMLQDQVVGLRRVVLDVEELIVDETSLVN